MMNLKTIVVGFIKRKTSLSDVNYAANAIIFIDIGKYNSKKRREK